jgi:hypothetical protein
MHWFAWWKLCYPKNEGGMGFRDFHSFDLSMLAKQVWRLVNDPESLCARVLRAKYYPQGDILKAGPKAGSSYTWQSIMAGLSTFKRGYIWRVGNGERINIWTDPWIPSSPDRRVISARGGALLTKVTDLIEPVTGQWDATLLSDLFNPVDASRILKIPINNQGFEDFVAWNLTSHGRFTVRSAYHAQWRHQIGASAGQLALPGRSAINLVWKIAWKLKVPSKVKIFIWRALHGILPLKCILCNRHIGTSGECPMCRLHAEDILHLLFHCEPAKNIWECLGLSSIIANALLADRSGSAVLEYILCLPDNTPSGFEVVQLKELVAVTCWYLWWLRRRQTHGESIPPCSDASSQFWRSRQMR